MFGLNKIFGGRRAAAQQRQAECRHEFEPRRMMGLDYYRCKFCRVRLYPEDYKQYMQQRREVVNRTGRINRGQLSGAGRRGKRRRRRG